MEKQTIYTKEEKVQELCARLPEIANELTEVMQGIKKRMPNVVFSPFIAYYIANGYGEQHEIGNAMQRAIAKSNGLNLENDGAKRFVDMACFRELRSLKNIAYLDRSGHRIVEDREKVSALQIYIRTGALSIDPNGSAIVAANFRQRLADFCSVTVESKAEKEAYKQMQAMKQAMQAVNDARAKLAAVMPKIEDAADIIEKGYTEKRILLCNDARLASDSGAARVLVSMLLKYRTNDAPRYYNSVGVPEYDAVALYQAFGIRREANPGLRYLYPEMYAAVSFRDETKHKPTLQHDDPYRVIYGHALIDYSSYLGRLAENPFIEDTPASLEALKALMKEYKKKGIKYHLDPKTGNIVND